jgi:hypothetical protein
LLYINTHNLLYEHTILELRLYVGMKLGRTLLHYSFTSKSHTETISGKEKKSHADATARSLSSMRARAAIKWAQSWTIAQYGPLGPRTRPIQPGRLRLLHHGALSSERGGSAQSLAFYSILPNRMSKIMCIITRSESAVRSSRLRTASDTPPRSRLAWPQFQ